MMLDTSDKIETQPDLKRNTVELIHELQKTGQPIVLAISGKAQLVVQDETSLRKLIELVDRLETIEGIRTGLEEMKAGKGRPAEEVFEEMRQEFNIPRGA